MVACLIRRLPVPGVGQGTTAKRTMLFFSCEVNGGGDYQDKEPHRLTELTWWRDEVLERSVTFQHSKPHWISYLVDVDVS